MGGQSLVCEGTIYTQLGKAGCNEPATYLIQVYDNEKRVCYYCATREYDDAVIKLHATNFYARRLLG